VQCKTGTRTDKSRSPRAHIAQQTPPPRPLRSYRTIQPFCCALALWRKSPEEHRCTTEDKQPCEVSENGREGQPILPQSVSIAGAGCRSLRVLSDHGTEQNLGRLFSTKKHLFLCSDPRPLVAVGGNHPLTMSSTPRSRIYRQGSASGRILDPSDPTSARHPLVSPTTHTALGSAFQSPSVDTSSAASEVPTRQDHLEDGDTWKQALKAYVNINHEELEQDVYRSPPCSPMPEDAMISADSYLLSRGYTRHGYSLSPKETPNPLGMISPAPNKIWNWPPKTADCCEDQVTLSSRSTTTTFRVRSPSTCHTISAANRQVRTRPPVFVPRRVSSPCTLLRAPLSSISRGYSTTNIGERSNQSGAQARTTDRGRPIITTTLVKNQGTSNVEKENRDPKCSSPDISTFHRDHGPSSSTDIVWCHSDMRIPRTDATVEHSSSVKALSESCSIHELPSLLSSSLPTPDQSASTTLSGSEDITSRVLTRTSRKRCLSQAKDKPTKDSSRVRRSARLRGEPPETPEASPTSPSQGWCRSDKHPRQHADANRPNDTT
jgi:hypothetical protein